MGSGGRSCSGTLARSVEVARRSPEMIAGGRERVLPLPILAQALGVGLRQLGNVAHTVSWSGERTF